LFPDVCINYNRLGAFGKPFKNEYFSITYGTVVHVRL
jgi:hypothetical protein